MKKFLLPISIILLSLLFTSCEQDVGIFASLERELPVTDENLNNKLTVPVMVSFGGDMYAMTSGFYHKTGSVWNHISLDSSSNGSTGYNIITSLAASALDLYVILGNSTSGDCRVFSYDGSSFTSVYPEAANEQLGSLFSIGNNCYFSVGRADGFHLYDADTGASTGGAVFNAMPVQGVNVAGTHYFIASTDLYSGNLGAVVLVAPSVYHENDSVPGKINALYSDGTNMFAFAEDGDIFCYNGTDWLDKITVQSGSSGIPLTCATSFDNGANTILMVGTKKKGYYEVSYTTGALGTIPEPHSPSSTELTTDYTNFNASDLKKASILSLVIDGTDAYAGTAGAGVWLNSGLDGDAIWNHQ